MKFNLAFITMISLLLMNCGKVDELLDVPNRMKDMGETTHQMKNGMDETNEAIRMQKISIALAEMQKPANREYLSPIPGDMMPAGKVLAEALLPSESVLLFKNYIKKINEEQFENRYPTVDAKSPEGQKLFYNFEHDKLADLMMLTIIAGFIPDQMMQQLIQEEAEQGAYQEVLFAILKLRFDFNNNLMLQASVLSEKLTTVGKINKAIEYNSKVDAIARLPFTDYIKIKITGFTDNEMNKELSKMINPKDAMSNWQKIYDHAQQDFVTMSFSNGDKNKQNAILNQKNAYNKSLKTIQQNLNYWNSKQ